MPITSLKLSVEISGLDIHTVEGLDEAEGLVAAAIASVFPSTTVKVQDYSGTVRTEEPTITQHFGPVDPVDLEELR